MRGFFVPNESLQASPFPNRPSIMCVAKSSLKTMKTRTRSRPDSLTSPQSCRTPEIAESPDLKTSRIWEALPAAAQARLGKIEVVDSVESTNDILYEEATPEYDRVQIARHQTHGRGRRGRDWQAVTGTLCFSILHSFAAQPPASLALWVGIAVIERLRMLGWGMPVLHWPNDLMYGVAKFGGILVESRVRDTRWVGVVGIGVNLEQAPPLDRPATSIAQACSRSPEPNELAAQLIDAVTTCLARIDNGTAGDLITFYSQYDGLKDCEVEITGMQNTLTGHARGVDAQGRLQVQNSQGIQCFEAAEVRRCRV